MANYRRVALAGAPRGMPYAFIPGAGLREHGYHCAVYQADHSVSNSETYTNMALRGSTAA